MRFAILFMLLVLAAHVHARGGLVAGGVASIAPCEQFLQPDTGALRETLQHTPGFGASGTEKKVADFTLSAGDLAMLARLNPASARTNSYFRFDEVPLPYTRYQTSVFSRNGRELTQNTYVFEGTQAGLKLRIELYELTSNSLHETQALLIVDDEAGTHLEAVLGDTGTGSVTEFDRDMNIKYEGKKYQYGTRVFTRLHVPEEGKPRGRKWQQRGSAELYFYIRVPDKLSAPIELRLFGYAFKITE